MRKVRRSFVTVALAVVAAFCCPGCLALMVPGLAYSGYKYEHDKNNAAASTQSDKSTTSSQQQKSPDNSIE